MIILFNVILILKDNLSDVNIKTNMLLKKELTSINMCGLYSTGTINNTATSNQTIYSFILHAEWLNTPTTWCEERIYFTKIYNCDTLVRDYVPVIDLQERPRLFDKVGRESYCNQGTGELLYG